MKFLPGQLPPELLPPEQLLLKSFPPHNYPETIAPMKFLPGHSSLWTITPGQLPLSSEILPTAVYHWTLDPRIFFPE